MWNYWQWYWPHCCHMSWISTHQVRQSHSTRDQTHSSTHTRHHTLCRSAGMLSTCACHSEISQITVHPASMLQQRWCRWLSGRRTLRTRGSVLCCSNPWQRSCRLPVRWWSIRGRTYLWLRWRRGCGQISCQILCRCLCVKMRVI